MRVLCAIVAVSAALLWLGCGGDDAATSAGETGSASAGGRDAPAGEAAPAPPPSPPPEPPRTIFPNLSPPDDPRFATITFGEGRHPKPEIDPPDGPLPQKLLVRDLEVGSGPVARVGDEAGVFYIGVDYASGKKQFQTWPPTAQPFVVQLRAYKSAEGWEKGIVGMRVGGRREVLVPSHLAFGNGALDYVFVLASLESAAERPPEG